MESNAPREVGELDPQAACCYLETLSKLYRSRSTSLQSEGDMLREQLGWRKDSINLRKVTERCLKICEREAQDWDEEAKRLLELATRLAPSGQLPRRRDVPSGLRDAGISVARLARAVPSSPEEEKAPLPGSEMRLSELDSQK